MLRIGLFITVVFMVGCTGTVENVTKSSVNSSQGAQATSSRVSSVAVSESSQAIFSSSSVSSDSVSSSSTSSIGRVYSIAWQSPRFVSAGVYSRVKQLKNGTLLLVYSEGPNVVFRRSIDDGESWSDQHVVKGAPGYNYTNSELLELANGELIYAWNARPTQDFAGRPFEIRTIISQDGGSSWVDERLVYAGADFGGRGVWEPAMVQLDSGEIQLFFANENPYEPSHEQEITLTRSFDNGRSWEDYRRTSFRTNYRDGMPSPLLLNNAKGIVYAIEDNGIDGDNLFKPAIIFTDLANNWYQGTAEAASARRWYALDDSVRLPSAIYAGAPYLAQLPTGETLLSFQSTLGRISNNIDHAIMQVYIGDDSARHFKNATTPFGSDVIAPDGNGLWNAMTALDNNTVIATSSIVTRNERPSGIYIVKGAVLRKSF